MRRLHAPRRSKRSLAEFKAMYAKPLTNALEASEQSCSRPLKERGVELLEVRPRVRHRSHRHRDAPKATAYTQGAWSSSRARPPMTSARGQHGAHRQDRRRHHDRPVGEDDPEIPERLDAARARWSIRGMPSARATGLVCKIVFAKGQLTVNGKPQAIPGLGGPPSEARERCRRRRRR